MIEGVFDRARFTRAAEWFAIVIAVSLPWSTTASGILIALWLVALIPTLNLQSLRWEIVIPISAIPIALFAYGVIGVMWGGASYEDQWGSIKPTLRLLAFPLLFIQFRNSDRGIWVIAGFLFSCTALLAVSWGLAMWPELASRSAWHPAVPVKRLHHPEWRVSHLRLRSDAFRNQRMAKGSPSQGFGVCAARACLSSQHRFCRGGPKYACGLRRVAFGPRTSAI